MEPELHVEGLDRYQVAGADVYRNSVFPDGGRRSPSGRYGPRGVAPVTLPLESGHPDVPVTPSGPPAHPLDRRVHDTGND
jgi:hypothetical protein